MTDTEKRREYQRNWNRQNRDKCREYKRNTAIRNAIKAIKAGDVVERTVLVSRYEAVNSEED